MVLKTRTRELGLDCISTEEASYLVPQWLTLQFERSVSEANWGSGTTEENEKTGLFGRMNAVWKPWSCCGVPKTLKMLKQGAVIAGWVVADDM